MTMARMARMARIATMIEILLGFRHVQVTRYVKSSTWLYVSTSICNLPLSKIPYLAVSPICKATASNQPRTTYTRFNIFQTDIVLSTDPIGQGRERERGMTSICIFLLLCYHVSAIRSGLVWSGLACIASFLAFALLHTT
jgi:hypothetical protein